MCGITGILQFSPSSRVEPALVRRMCDVMAHRGPDDDGVYTSGPVGLGMRRLSIVDLATGHQPLSNEDGTIWIVFNGEIYNHADLRPGLESRGHVYRTHSDTETIIHLYEEYGHDCVQHLRGMFAFAIWDSRQQRLFVARDRLGIKPLYYHLTAQRIVFGSEIKVVLTHPEVVPEFRRSALPEYLAFGYLSGEETFYSGIRKLMPGHWMEVDTAGKVEIQRYWDLPITQTDASRSEADYVREYRELLEHAVRSHLMSDVPLGVFLSGGVDSSAVAALMTKIRGTPVETFSVGYTEDAYSELPYARIVAKHLNSVHHEVLLSQQEFFDTLPHLIWHEDEPIVWPSSVALYFVARVARERVKVVLTGEGSDETLAGYTRYSFTLKNAAWDRMYRGVTPSVVRRWVRGLIADSSWISADLRRKLSHTFLARDGNDWASFYFDNFFSAFSEGEQADLFSPELKEEFSAGGPYKNVLEYWQHSSGPMLQRLLYTDIKTYLVELLMKQDNMSMATSIESRVPFLDHVLVEFATNIPERLQLGGFAGKRILKKAVEDLLPHSILYRPKLGFPTPWSRWLAGPQLEVIRDLLLEPRSLERGLFQRSALERLFQEHRSGYRDHYDRIWRLLNLELWQRVCIEKEEHQPASTVMA
ncbi:MAG TPA: asparagine synthase (glutamine-hydrolyzing) [Candidatus Sulfotelmatobacter sp.]|nr:asparagine synthase (glutamine-hydrolyzing) [Candidatus Sulfotelmatobacter sp.]